jgi:hypothetical protein
MEEEGLLYTLSTTIEWLRILRCRYIRFLQKFGWKLMENSSECRLCQYLVEQRKKLDSKQLEVLNTRKSTKHVYGLMSFNGQNQVLPSFTCNHWWVLVVHGGEQQRRFGSWKAIHFHGLGQSCKRSSIASHHLGQVGILIQVQLTLGVYVSGNQRICAFCGRFQRNYSKSEHVVNHLVFEDITCKMSSCVHSSFSLKIV